MRLSILYRGALSSCNYGCDYCPFAKRRESREELELDRLQVERFVRFVAGRTDDRIGVLFTPWGEALIRPWYQEALVALSCMPHVTKVSIQTNISAPLEWTERCDLGSLALWTTYHPTQVTRERFLAKTGELLRRGVRHSVGVVGMRENLDEIEAIRQATDDSVYVWVNAYKREPNYYTQEDLARLRAVDPLFDLNTERHASAGEACATGDTVISVDGEGTVRRCHFVKTPLGNLYEAGFPGFLGPRRCPNATCGCFIGYVHLERLGLYHVYDGGELERIPRLRLPVV
jgi:MoaA/NifB/PqqE/SkfB family radical SAM enzyme